MGECFLLGQKGNADTTTFLKNKKFIKLKSLSFAYHGSLTIEATDYSTRPAFLSIGYAPKSSNRYYRTACINLETLQAFLMVESSTDSSSIKTVYQFEVGVPHGSFGITITDYTRDAAGNFDSITVTNSWPDSSQAMILGFE